MIRPRRNAWSFALFRALVLLASLLAATVHGLAGWREDMKTFRIGLIAEDGAGQAVPGLSVLRQAYSRILAMPVEIFVARDYAALIDAQATRRIDYAVYSATAYATAVLLCGCVEPVAAPVGEDGATGIRAILVTRDGRLAGVADIPAHKVAIAPADSIAGFALPQFELKGTKMAFSGGEPFIVRADSASAAEAMLADGSVDAIFGWVPANADAALAGGTLDRLAAAGIDKASLSVIWTSSLLRYGPHALRSGLDPQLRRALVVFLTGLKELQPDVYDLLETHRGGGFVEAGPQDYATAVDMVRSLAGEAGRQ